MRPPPPITQASNAIVVPWRPLAPTVPASVRDCTGDVSVAAAGRDNVNYITMAPARPVI